MSEMHQALQVGVEEDLLPLSALLHQRGVPHRIYEKDGQQVVEVADVEHAAQVQALYQAWQSGELRIEMRRRSAGSRPPVSPLAQWRSFPITVALVALSIVGFALISLQPLNALAAWLVFTPFSTIPADSLVEQMQGQYWRSITPVFLHGGWLHIAFNALWLWELGSKVESVMGRLNMLMLFLVISLVSNTSQYLFGGGGTFGGMSGVVYGLLGFAWVAPILQPRWNIQPAQPIMLFMVGWLVLCLLGVVEMVGLGAIANAAHVSGLLCGAVLGGLFGLLSRSNGDTGSGAQV